VYAALPAGLDNAGDLSGGSIFTQADTAHLKLAIKSLGTSADRAAVMLTYLELRRALRLVDHRDFCHGILPLVPERHAHVLKQGLAFFIIFS